jgi:hypothetical protein
MPDRDKPKKPAAAPEEFARIDSFREDEDTGGAGAAPLRPRTPDERAPDERKPDLPDELSKRPKGPAQP